MSRYDYVCGIAGGGSSLAAFYAASAANGGNILRVFISHSAKDEALASAVADLMEEGTGSQMLHVFCSSSAKRGIPAGEDFKAYIRMELQKCDIVIAILTKNYHASAF